MAQAGRSPAPESKRAFARLFRRKILERPFGIVHLTTPGSIEATIFLRKIKAAEGSR